MSNELAAISILTQKNEKLIEKLIEKNILTPYGEMKLILYKDKILEESHIALVKGEIQKPIIKEKEPNSCNMPVKMRYCFSP